MASRPDARWFVPPGIWQAPFVEIDHLAAIQPRVDVANGAAVRAVQMSTDIGHAIFFDAKAWRIKVRIR